MNNNQFVETYYNDIKNALVNYEKADNMIKDNILIKKMISFIIIKFLSITL